MREDILKRREEIIGWIESSNYCITNTELCKRLKCYPGTLASYLKQMGIDYAGNQGSRDIKVIPDEDWFVENSTRATEPIKKRLKQYNLIPYSCHICSIVEWENKPLNLHLDHINGINSDNRLENLRFLCPNCHSQTDTYCGKAINSGSKKVSDAELKKALDEQPNIRKALLSVGLTAKGGNYNRCYKLLSRS